MTAYKDQVAKMNAIRMKMYGMREELRALQAAITPEPVKDYQFETADGPKKLSDLFGDKETLIVIHNMGTTCSYCTLWADGYSGLYDHLNNAAAFWVISPDDPKQQAQFAKSRNWRFPMASLNGNSFAKDMGFQDEKGGYHPGISVFQKQGDQVARVSDTMEGPYDDFNPVWHLLDMIPGGAAGWEPKFKY